jgi:hypothetical protein
MMQPFLKATLAGAAALVAAAGLTPALAGDGGPHVMNVRMPDGSVTQIEYFGDVPPRVVLAPVPVAIGTPPFDAPIGFGSSFAAMQRIAAMMDRQAEMMMRQAAAMQEATMRASAPVLPSSAHAYAISSSTGGGNVCMRSVQITYRGDAAPQVVSRTAGNCGPEADSNAPASVSTPAPVAPAPQSRPRTIEVRANTDRPLLAMAQPLSTER